MFFSFFVIPLHNTNAALVPCGLSSDDPSTPFDETKPCGICDTLKLVDNIIDFLLFTVVPAVAVLMYLIAGLMILLGGANPDLVATGTNIFKTTSYGLVIIFAAWMITNTVIKSLAGDGDISTKWHEIECSEGERPIPTTPPPQTRYACNDNNQCIVQPGGQYTTNNCDGRCAPTEVTPPVGSELQDLAKQIKADPSLIGLSTGATCGGNNHAKQNITDIADGKVPSVCSPSCNCLPGGPDGNVTVNPQILSGLLGLGQWMEDNNLGGVTITSLTTGRHSANSDHYRGDGVDIDLISANPADWQKVRQFLDDFGGNGGNAICEGPDGNDVPSCDLTQVSHIHWSFDR
ncbi:MAG: pilin [Candidatus Paceibacterota bacterium]